MAHRKYSCGICGDRDTSIIGTVTVQGTGIRGRLKLSTHINPETGKPCAGDDYRVLLRAMITLYNR